MKRLFVLFSLCGILITSCQAQEKKEEKQVTTTTTKDAKIAPVYLTQEAFKQKVFDYTDTKNFKYLGDKPCVIDIYAVWCGPCKRLAPILEELAEEYKGKVQFYKVDAEKETELSGALGIRSYPTLLFIAKDKKPVIIEGAYPKEELKKIIQTNLLDTAK